MTQLVTADDILSSGGDHPDRIQTATHDQRVNAAVLAARVNALLTEFGYKKRPGISDGLRPADAAYGAPKSAHKEGKAVDFFDRTGVLKGKVTSALLKKHGLRMEHPDATPSWCHLDTRTPYGSIFKP